MVEVKLKTEMRAIRDEDGDIYDKEGKPFVAEDNDDKPFDAAIYAFDKEGKEAEKLEVLLCPNYPECSVYIHEDTKKHREVIKRHIKRKHSETAKKDD